MAAHSHQRDIARDVSDTPSPKHNAPEPLAGEIRESVIRKGISFLNKTRCNA